MNNTNNNTNSNANSNTNSNSNKSKIGRKSKTVNIEPVNISENKNSKRKTCKN